MRFAAFAWACLLATVALAQDCVTSTYSESHGDMGALTKISVATDGIVQMDPISFVKGNGNGWSVTAEVNSLQDASAVIFFQLQGDTHLKFQVNEPAAAGVDFNGGSTILPSIGMLFAALFAHFGTFKWSRQVSLALFLVLSVLWVQAICLSSVSNMVVSVPDGWTCAGKVCEKNVCVCSDGVAAEDAACTTNGASICASCNSGFFLDGAACTADPVCVCSDGVAAVDAACTTDGASICASCNAGFSLENAACRVNKCAALAAVTSPMTVVLSATTTHGSVATYGCITGYTYSGDATLTCDASTAGAAWPTPTATPTCTVNNCAALTVSSPMTVALSATTTHGSVATYGCITGYTYSGDATLTCDASTDGAEWPMPASATPTCTADPVCVCANGVPVTGKSQCTVDGANSCASCNSGFVLEAGACGVPKGDGCDAHTCTNLGTCNSLGETTFSCTCKTGADNDADALVCVDTAGCANNPCNEFSTCADKPFPATGHTCTCKTGADNTADPSVCVDTDGCANSPCGTGGSCADKVFPATGYTCTCNSDTHQLSADSSTCEDKPGVFVATTSLKFPDKTPATWTTADQDKLLAGLKASLGTDQTIVLKTQITDGQLEVVVELQYSTLSGATAGSTKLTDGGVTLDASLGSFSSAVLTEPIYDIDGCAGNACDANSVCVDTPAPGTGYTCKCNGGYVASGATTCVNKDACDPNPCGLGSCTDDAPPSEGYTCACGSGASTGTVYEGGTCKDIDGCAVNDCPGAGGRTGTCVDTPAPGTGKTCLGFCGDGKRVGTEECDDGNEINFDGCSKACTVESGMTCTGGSTTTKDTCADTNGCADASSCRSYETCQDKMAPYDGYKCKCNDATKVEQVMSFTGSSTADVVKMSTDDFFPSPEVSALTTCLWVKPLTRSNRAILSVANDKYNNAYLLLWEPTRDARLTVFINDAPRYSPTKWVDKDQLGPNEISVKQFHQVCVVWESTTGTLEIWIDAKLDYTEEGFRRDQMLNFKSGSQIAIGQEQDWSATLNKVTYDVAQSFQGHLSQLFMWDRRLSAAEVEDHYYARIANGYVVGYCDVISNAAGAVAFVPQETAGFCANSVLFWTGASVNNIITLLMYPDGKVPAPNAHKKGYLSAPLTGITQCMWTRYNGANKGLTSWAVDGVSDNMFLLYYTSTALNFYFFGPSREVGPLNNDNVWRHYCIAWDNQAGAKFYINGIQNWADPTLGRGVTLPNKGRISIGQEQDCEGGCFEDSQAFSGSMTAIYMWTRALNEYEVFDTFKGKTTPNWIWGFDNCQLSEPVDGGIIFKSRELEKFPGAS